MIAKFAQKKQYTHFLSLPFIRKQHRDQITNIQKMVSQNLQKVINHQQLRKSSNNLAHLTISMLTLANNESKLLARQVLHQHRDLCLNVLQFIELTFPKLGYFTRYNHKNKIEEVSVIYLQVHKDGHIEKVNKVVDQLVRRLLQQNIIKKQELRSLHIRFNKETQSYENESYHLTLFRLQNTINNQAFRASFEEIQKQFKMVRFQVDFVDISTRSEYDESKFYSPLARIALPSKPF